GPEVGFALVEGALAQRTPKASFAALTQTRPFLSAFDERARWLELEAQIYDLEGAFHRAIASRRNACRLTPTAACHFRLARALERMGDVAQARDAVRTGARLGPQPPPETTTSWLGELERRLAAQQGGRDGASGSAGMETDALLRRLGGRGSAGCRTSPCLRRCRNHRQRGTVDCGLTRAVVRPPAPCPPAP